MKEKTGTLDYIIRIIYLLPVLILAVLESVKKLIKFVIDYVRYGGEMIVYCKQNSRTTILDCFEKLREIQEGQKKVEKTCETCKYKGDGKGSLACDYCTVINSCWEPKETDKK